MLEDMSADFWAECLEFYALEPFGFPVLDMWHGMQCAMSIAPHLKKGATADPRDYMLRRTPEREPTPDETEALLDAIFKTAAVRTTKQD